VVAALVYGASPIDLVPDVLVLIGWVDDLVVLVLLLGLAALHFYRSRSRQSPRDPAWLTSPSEVPVDAEVVARPGTPSA